MRHTLQHMLWTGIIGLLALINITDGLTCPIGTATSTADPLVISACSTLSSLVSEEAQTGGTAVVTVFITFPASTAPGTTTTASTTSLVTTSTSSTGQSSSRSPRTVTMTSNPNASTSMSTSRSHSTMRTVRSHSPTQTSRSQTTGRVSNTNVPAAASSDSTGMPPHSSNSSSDDNYTTGVVIPVAVVCTVVPVMLILWLIWFCAKRRRRRQLAAGSPATSVEPINFPNEKDGAPPPPPTTEKQSMAENQETSTSRITSNPPQLAYLFGPAGDVHATVFPQPSSGTTEPPTPSSPAHSPRDPSLEAQSYHSPLQSHPSEEHSSPKRDSDEARGVGGLTALREETDQSSSAQDAESDVMARGGTWFAASIQEDDDEDSEPPVPQEPVPQAPKPPPIPDISPDRQKRSSSSWLSLASRHSLNSSVSGAQAESSSAPPPPPPPPPVSPPTSGFSTPQIMEANRGQTLKPVPYKLYPR